MIKRMRSRWIDHLDTDPSRPRSWADLISDLVDAIWPTPHL